MSKFRLNLHQETSSCVIQIALKRPGHLEYHIRPYQSFISLEHVWDCGGLSNRKDELFDNHLFDDCYSIECKRKKKRKKSAVFDKINGYLTIHHNPKHILNMHKCSNQINRKYKIIIIQCKMIREKSSERSIYIASFASTL